MSEHAVKGRAFREGWSKTVSVAPPPLVPKDDPAQVDGDGALWTKARLEAARGGRPERFDRVVVGIDPPAGRDGAACGIVVAGKFAGRGYVLADFSVAGLSPIGWGRARCGGGARVRREPDHRRSQPGRRHGESDARCGGGSVSGGAGACTRRQARASRAGVGALQAGDA